MMIAIFWGCWVEKEGYCWFLLLK